MSFDVFVECFEHGKSNGIPEREIRAAFGSALRDDPQFECWLVGYGPEPTGTSTVYFSRDSSDAEKITGFMVNRPLADPRFWNAIYRIMLLGNVVLVFPGNEHPLVAAPAAIEHLPEGLQDAVVVENGQGIVAAIQSA
jgi:hypothetical protein